MQASFLHFPNALDMWTKHPYERDACLMRSAFEGEGRVLPTKILVEVICTRKPVQLVGAKMVYQNIYGITLEEQLETYAPQTLELKLLGTMLLVSGDKEQDDVQRDVRTLFHSLRHSGENRALELVTNETIHYIDMVLKEQYRLVNNASCEENGVNHEIIKAILKCRRDPVTYFVEVIDEAFEANDADALTRVIVTLADEDMPDIKKAFLTKHGISLHQKIKNVAKGNYKNFMLWLLAYSRDD